MDYLYAYASNLSPCPSSPSENTRCHLAITPASGAGIFFRQAEPFPGEAQMARPQHDAEASLLFGYGAIIPVSTVRISRYTPVAVTHLCGLSGAPRKKPRDNTMEMFPSTVWDPLSSFLRVPYTRRRFLHSACQWYGSLYLFSDTIN
jgi:hypothetical protein